MDAAAKKKKGQNELGVITKRPGNATHFPAPGCTCRVHYEARLENGDVFDSSRDRKRALIFKLGAGEAIPAFEEAVREMRVGGIRRIEIPGELEEKLAYSRNAAGASSSRTGPHTTPFAW